MGSNSGEGMDTCKCIVPSWHGGTVNSRRAASPLVRWVEVEERWEALVTFRMFSQNWDGTKPKSTVTCIELKAKATNRSTSDPLTR
ncbi:hypothetical protein TNCV_830971 [Trichonephila clavipes]|nr:hypothetical protein TNCV_830971 [Trichonephila clavipes]